MLYTDAIYLILALILFSGWPAENTSLREVFPLFLLKEGVFVFIVYFRFRRTRSVKDFLRTQALLKFLAFLFFALDVIFLGIPGLFRDFSFFRDLAGLFLFLHYLFILWLTAAFYEKRNTFIKLSPSSYVWSNFKFLFPFLIPWGLVNLIFSLEGRFLPLKGLSGEFVYLGIFLGTLILFMAPLAVKFWDCHPLPESNLRHQIEAYLKCQRTKIREILLWESFSGRLLTAGVIGVLPPFRYLLLATGLLAALEEAEILSVVAHEVGHLRKRHLLWLLLFFVLFSLLVYLAFYPAFLAFLAYFPFPELLAFLPTERFFLPEALFTLGLVLAVVLYFRFLLGFFLRNFERQADLYCLESLGTAKGLIRAFQKIAALSGHTEDLPSWHHFSIRERISFLQAAEKDPALIKNHHRKVRLWLSFYLFVSALLGVFFWNVPQEELEERAKLHIFYGMLKHDFRLFPELKTMEELGNLAYELGKEKEALLWYKKVLEGRSLPEVKNNMAWILITARDKSLRDYHAGLLLARAATAEKLLATHLDTLAEAWFANGNPDRACIYASLALERALKAPDFYPNPDYYRSQKEKFCHATR